MIFVCKDKPFSLLRKGKQEKKWTIRRFLGTSISMLAQFPSHQVHLSALKSCKRTVFIMMFPC